MGLGGELAPPLGDEEPTPAWVSAVLGVDLEEADWLLVLYRFADQDAPRPAYFCEPL
jgi:hypothetical protein